MVTLNAYCFQLLLVNLAAKEAETLSKLKQNMHFNGNFAFCATKQVGELINSTTKLDLYQTNKQTNNQT